VRRKQVFNFLPLWFLSVNVWNPVCVGGGQKARSIFKAQRKKKNVEWASRRSTESIQAHLRFLSRIWLAASLLSTYAIIWESNAVGIPLWFGLFPRTCIVGLKEGSCPMALQRKGSKRKEIKYPSRVIKASLVPDSNLSLDTGNLLSLQGNVGMCLITSDRCYLHTLRNTCFTQVDLPCDSTLCNHCSWESIVKLASESAKKMKVIHNCGQLFPRSSLGSWWFCSSWMFLSVFRRHYRTPPFYLLLIQFNAFLVFTYVPVKFNCSITVPSIFKYSKVSVSTRFSNTI
jgi:hypothetical protein